MTSPQEIQELKSQLIGVRVGVKVKALQHQRKGGKPRYPAGNDKEPAKGLALAMAGIPASAGSLVGTLVLGMASFSSDRVIVS